MAIELPEWGTAQTNELEPSESLKANGWANGDQPPAAIFNWLGRTTYETSRRAIQTSLGASYRIEALGPLVAPSAGSNSLVRAVEADADGTYILSGSADTGSDVFISTFDGVTLTEHLYEADTDGATGIIISDGLWAAIAADGHWYHAAHPYSSWTKVDPGTALSSAFRGFCLTSSLALVANTAVEIVSTARDTRPTVDGDWTATSVSSLLTTLDGIACGDGVVVLIGEDGTGEANIAYAPEADALTPGSYTVVNLGTGAGAGARNIIWDGSQFVARGGTSILTSPDGATWTVRGYADSDLFLQPGVAGSYIGKVLGSNAVYFGVDGYIGAAISNTDTVREASASNGYAVGPDGRLISGSDDTLARLVISV